MGSTDNFSGNMLNFDYISIKSRIGVEYRRYALGRNDVRDFDTLYRKVESMHQLNDIPFVIFYTDSDNCTLPINNDDNLAKAIKSAKHIHVSNIRSKSNNNNNNNDTSNINYNGYISNTYHHQYKHLNYPPALIKRPYLRLLIVEKDAIRQYYNGNLTGKLKKNQNFMGFSNFITSSSASSEQNNLRPSIGAPEDFRQVSSIIDVDSVPETCRRVRIVKHGSDKPLGFYIRDGTYKRMNAHGQVELVTGVFISRLVPGGLAESTGLLAVNDEVLEVNGIQVMHGKTLDQVTDMMVANSSNLIMTIRPGRMNYVA